jgi:hypothetical protein
MRSMKRVVVALAAGGLLVAGGTAAGIVLTQGTARAANVSFCQISPGTGSQCIESDLTVPDPTDIYALLASPSGSKGLIGNLTWELSCPSTAAATDSTQDSVAIPGTVFLAQGINISSSDSCTLSVTLFVVNFSSDTENVTMTINEDQDSTASSSPSATPTPSPTASVPSGGVTGKIKGFDDKCVTDSGNSSSLRATVESSTCNGSSAQSWRYAAGELIHNGLCWNDKGNAGNGGKVILWTCNGSQDEEWVHQLNNTYELRAHNWTLCLTIPGSSKKNGVQLQADTCKHSADQDWTVP